MSAIAPELDLYEEIERLRKERNAVILAHYYQEDEIQDLADFIGDSLQLAKAARSRPAPALAAWKEAHPDHLVVSYINCTAGTKALSDVICTSSNAVRVIESLPKDKPILFAPDRNLGAYVQRQTGRPMELWQGTCIVHETFSERKLIDLKARHPDAKVIAHPECEPELLAHADHIGSTSSLLKYATESGHKTFIVATEPGIIHQMEKAAPENTYLPLPGLDDSCNCNECPFMRLNTVEKLYLALRDLEPQITMDEELRLAALKPLERMMALG